MNSGLSEDFSYDGLDRLTQSNVNGNIGGIDYNTSIDYAYDIKGNIVNKSNVGAYQYNSNIPHSPITTGSNNFVYDGNGNMIKNGAKRIAWTSFNKPKAFNKDSFETQFFYGADRSRYLKVQNGIGRTIYIGKLYEKITNNNTVQNRHFIYADGQLIAIHTKAKEDGVKKPDETRYLHRDNLGSIDTITDGKGSVVERMSYQSFGARRKGDWRNSTDLILPKLTNRGFTGHEHIDEMCLIHMNGRVYDQNIGRFLSPDPNIQAPYNTQSYNRYSYVLNNPLKYTDPSGYFFNNIFKFIDKVERTLLPVAYKVRRTVERALVKDPILRISASRS
jgi:RHS repeat-associated protein